MKAEAIVNLLRDNVKSMKAYSSARDDFHHNDKTPKVFLDANENPYNNELNRYPDPYQQKVKIKLSKLKSISPDNILIGNGSDEVLDLIFRVFCEPLQDKIITLPPTYGMYRVLADINTVMNIPIPLLAKDMQPNVEKIISTEAKLLFLCSPNNPTGHSIDEICITQLLKYFRGIVVIDEAYIDFSIRESWISRLHKYPNLIITQTFSKAYGLAGVRMGVCYASPYIISMMHRIKLPYNINTLTQNTVVATLDNPQKIELQINEIIKNRTWLIEKLSKISFVEKIYPTEANFILARVDDADNRYQELIFRNIVVRNRSKEILCEQTLRFTVGTNNENKRLIAALQDLT